ncbi:MAG: hypothetical protein JO284_15640, partial [Planctomycetaceae bacterium]|nr:hypothetical protein [Planctomycetaceae bacterium]
MRGAERPTSTALPRGGPLRVPTFNHVDIHLRNMGPLVVHPDMLPGGAAEHRARPRVGGELKHRATE